MWRGISTRYRRSSRSNAVSKKSSVNIGVSHWHKNFHSSDHEKLKNGQNNLPKLALHVGFPVVLSRTSKKGSRGSEKEATYRANRSKHERKKIKRKLFIGSLHEVKFGSWSKADGKITWKFTIAAGGSRKLRWNVPDPGRNTSINSFHAPPFRFMLHSSYLRTETVKWFFIWVCFGQLVEGWTFFLPERTHLPWSWIGPRSERSKTRNLTRRIPDWSHQIRDEYWPFATPDHEMKTWLFGSKHFSIADLLFTTKQSNVDP